MRTLRAAVPKPTPALDAALTRIEQLELAYAASVQRVLKSGSFWLWELLIAPIDARREKFVSIASAWADGRAVEAQVLEAADELAALMRLVIGEGSDGREPGGPS